MNSRKLITAAALASSALAAFPAGAEAHGHGYGHHRHGYYERADYRRDYYQPRRSCRTSGTTGLIVGGAAGALLGRELDGGRDRTTGTVLGAGAGALLGREISRKSHC